MRKKLLGITIFAAALTLSTGITAFAGTWKEDALGKYYENDDGSRPVYAGWFTDPADGVVYGMDPDGYVMINSDMGAFSTDDMGRRIDPTEEELQRAAERKAELATRPSPAKKHAAAEVAANAAKTSNVASTTTRSSYQAEMKVFMEKLFNDTKTKRSDTTVRVAGTEDNTELTYAFQNPDGYSFVSATIWKSAKPTAVNYKEHAFEFSYHFDSAAKDMDLYNDLYHQMAVATLGETEGAAVLDYVQNERNNGNTSFDRTGNTDVGNSYKLTYRSGLVTIAVTCSEVVPESENAANDTAAETPEADTAVAETTPITSVIVAGQAAETTDDTAQDSADTTQDSADTAQDSADTDGQAAAGEDTAV